MDFLVATSSSSKWNPRRKRFAPLMVICIAWAFPPALVKSFGTQLPSSCRRQLSLELSISKLGEQNIDSEQLLEYQSGLTIISSVETQKAAEMTNPFDPTTINDTFWVSLQSNDTPTLLGQILALGALTLVASLLPRLLQQQAVDVTKKTVLSRSYQHKQDNFPTEASGSLHFNVGKLLFCIVIDILGSASEVFPVFGELTDFAYAPIAAYVLRAIFGGSNVLFFFEFGEEIFPFTDIFPFATICWLAETFFPSSSVCQILQIGKYRNNP